MNNQEYNNGSAEPSGSTDGERSRTVFPIWQRNPQEQFIVS